MVSLFPSRSEIGRYVVAGSRRPGSYSAVATRAGSGGRRSATLTAKSPSGLHDGIGNCRNHRYQDDQAQTAGILGYL